MKDYELLELEKPLIDEEKFEGVKVTVFKEKLNSKKGLTKLTEIVLEKAFITKDFFWFDPFLALAPNSKIELAVAYAKHIDFSKFEGDPHSVNNFIIFQKNEDGLLIFRTSSKRAFTYCYERGKDEILISKIQVLFKD